MMAGMTDLIFREREADGDPRGPARAPSRPGADESDLLSLADVLDPARRLHVVTPRAPLTLAGWSGYHWYVVPRVGYPDPDTFDASFRRLAEFHDELWSRTGLTPGQTVLGGFSMGSVMSYSLGLSASGPRPPGSSRSPGSSRLWMGGARRFEDRRSTRIFIAHGRNDPIMDVGFARRARELLESGGLEVEYHESDAAHHIDPAHVPAAVDWLAATLGSETQPLRSPPQQLTGEQRQRDPDHELHRALPAERRLAVLALAHVHRHLDEPQLGVGDAHERLHLGRLADVGIGEQL